MPETEGSELRRIAVLVAEEAREMWTYFRPFTTPGGDDTWRGMELVLNPPEGDFDGIVVHQSMAILDREYRLQAPRGRTLLSVVEPPDLLWLPEGYTRQFGLVHTPDKRTKGRVRWGAGQHRWFLEVPYQEALTFAPEKDGDLSAVVSARQATEGHRVRLELMRSLADHFGERLDWFGRGVRELGAYKRAGLERYRYHVVLENGTWPHYWTEKLSDAFVANCFPFYAGAPNAAEYFPEEAFCPIDPAQPEQVAATIEQAIRDDWWSQRQSALAEARRRVLEDYHPYEQYRRRLSELPAGPREEVIIRPHDQFPHSLRQRVERKLGW